MRSSLSKLLEACELKTPSMAAFLSGLQSSGWLKHIHSILDTSLAVARSLQEGVNVLVHCSDGQIHFFIFQYFISIDFKKYFLFIRLGPNGTSLLIGSGASRSLLPHSSRIPGSGGERLVIVWS